MDFQPKKKKSSYYGKVRTKSWEIIYHYNPNLRGSQSTKSHITWDNMKSSKPYH